MPVFNAGNWLEETILSIIHQDFQEWELIAIDDFSEDGSTQILEKYAALDTRIQWKRNNQKGIIAALELAFHLAKGTYITRMDADDLMPEDKLRLFYETIIGQDHKTVVTGRVRYFFGEGSVSEGYERYQDWLNDLDELTIWQHIYRECVIASPNWLVHRSFFEEFCRFSDLSYPEDYDMAFHWYKNGFRVKRCNRVTHLWREHKKRTSRNSEVYQQASFFALKTEWFLELEQKLATDIQLIGAGEKGKLVAEVLTENGIDFQWFDFQSERYAAGINGNEILSLNELDPSKKTILTVWPKAKAKQHNVTSFMTSKGFNQGKNYWVF